LGGIPCRFLSQKAFKPIAFASFLKNFNLLLSLVCSRKEGREQARKNKKPNAKLAFGSFPINFISSAHLSYFIIFSHLGQGE